LLDKSLKSPAATMTAVGLLSTYLAARRATGIDPLSALRS
jgi:hypothetical protein